MNLNSAYLDSKAIAGFVWFIQTMDIPIIMCNMAETDNL